MRRLLLVALILLTCVGCVGCDFDDNDGTRLDCQHEPELCITTTPWPTPTRAPGAGRKQPAWGTW